MNKIRLILEYQEKSWGKDSWQRARENVLLLAALKVLLKGDHAKAGEAYAIESSHCWRCGKLLTVPVSVANGLGPECAKVVA